MTLETLTRPQPQVEPESRPAEGATPAFHLHPNVDAASPEPIAEPFDLTLTIDSAARPGAAQSCHDTQGRSGGATPSAPAQPSTEAPNDERLARGGGHMNRADLTSTAAAQPSARHSGPEPRSTNASKGGAQTRPAKAGKSLGVPTHSEPTLEVTPPYRGLSAQGGDQCDRETQSLSVPATPLDLANSVALPNDALPGPGDSLRNSAPHTCVAVADLSDPPLDRLSPIVATADRSDGPSSTDAHRAEAVATIVDLWRQRVDLRRAEGRLNLQALAVCRRANGGDKEAAQKAWTAIQRGKGTDPALTLVVEPYRLAMDTLDTSAKGLEKQLAKLVRPLPLWTWAKDVRGLGELSAAGLIGESAGNPGAYKSVSALWKRFGLAVIDGGRQRRVTGAEDALRHGYAPQRRAFAYVLSTQLMRSQKDSDPYRALYDRRKAYELEREIPKAHAHNRALRVMVKELLKHAWVADRRGD